MKKDLYRIMNYIIIGGFTTLVNIIVYWLFADLLGLDYRIATTVAWIASVLFAYITNKKYVFESRTSRISELVFEMFSFFGFRLLSFFMDLVTMIILVSGIDMNGVWAKIWSNLIVLIANYIFSKYFIFKNK